LEDLDDYNWVTPFKDLDDPELYVVGLYFVMTTTTTIGYGDISANSTTERLFTCCLMIVGVVSFTFISGALSSLLSSYDTK
jgi:hypothetical protein